MTYVDGAMVDPADAVRRLAGVDACAVSDALDALELPGVAPGIGSVSVPVAIAGRVRTVQLEPAGAREPTRHLAVDAISAAAAGDVIVVANGGRDHAACWGGLLSLAAGQRGLAGAVLDGACRDVEEARRLGWPVFATAVTPRTARGRYVEVGTGVNVTVAGVAVGDGDYVIADASGVVFVAQDVLGRVLPVAERIVAHETVMADSVTRGDRLEDVLGRRYETLLAEDDS